jgi:glyoxylase-like metal-dependent hydrolase (beta-lactamase superfamily II)
MDRFYQFLEALAGAYLQIGASRSTLLVMPKNLIHRFEATGGGTPVNAYIIEGPRGIVVIDATLTVSDGRALRSRVQEAGKPLLGVVITHTHPDHYGGLVELIRGSDVPVFAAAGVAEAIRRDEPVKEEILRPMFGDEWAHERALPTEEVADGDSIALDGIELTVTNLGPGESPQDSIWALDGDGELIFSADLAYDRHHCYLADGFHEQWLASIERLRGELPAGATLHPGHGEPCGVEVLGWQAGYINAFLDAVRDADWAEDVAARKAVIDRMHDYLPTGTLQFLMELSIDPIVEQLGLRQ